MLPISTIIGLQTGLLLSGAVLTETVFQYPGVGNWIAQAIFNRDYPVIQGGILFLAFVFVIVNLVVDISYAFINPGSGSADEHRGNRVHRARARAPTGGLWREAWFRLKREPERDRRRDLRRSRSSWSPSSPR